MNFQSFPNLPSLYLQLDNVKLPLIGLMSEEQKRSKERASKKQVQLEIDDSFSYLMKEFCAKTSFYEFQ
jgi:hypothetical protein